MAYSKTDNFLLGESFDESATHHTKELKDEPLEFCGKSNSKINGLLDGKGQ